MIRAVVFDCFGVLITDALQLLVEKHPAQAAKIHDLILASNRGVVDSEKISHEIAAVVGLTYQEYRAYLQHGEVKNADLLAYILTLRDTPCKTALLSNISSEGLARRFELNELERYFDVIIASGAIGYAKPESEAYEITADRLGVRLDECLFIDDRELYVAGAQRVGMQSFVYESLEQCQVMIARHLGN